MKMWIKINWFISTHYVQTKRYIKILQTPNFNVQSDACAEIDSDRPGWSISWNIPKTDLLFSIISKQN